ncbi:MAG: hypothetical protein ABIH72_04325 [archaeon]
MDQELIIEVLKWILIVFIAGFIGYFGKYLSKIIIAKIHKKPQQAQTIIHQHESSEKYKAGIQKQKAKVEKKKIKLEKKKLKLLKKKKK